MGFPKQINLGILNFHKKILLHEKLMRFSKMKIWKKPTRFFPENNLSAIKNFILRPETLTLNQLFLVSQMCKSGQKILEGFSLLLLLLISKVLIMLWDSLPYQTAEIQKHTKYKPPKKL